MCLLLGVLTFFACCNSGEARIDDICKLFINNTIIGDPESCSRYITCIDSKSYYSTCSGKTPFFDKDTQKCVATPTTTDDGECNMSCVNATGTWISDPKSCYGYYYCASEESYQYGTCADNLHFNQTQQRCVYKSTSECKAHEFDYCSIVKNDIKFDNVLACNQYYECKKGKLTSSECKSTYYDAPTGKCVAKNLVQCDSHPLPTDVCGTTKSPKKNTFVSDGATCQGYFYCDDKNGKPDDDPIWGHCGSDLFFDATTQTCRHPNLVKCSEDRCQGRTIPFVLSSTKGCRHYLRCKDGRTLDEKSCGNYFFDEDSGSCVSKILTYAVC